MILCFDFLTSIGNITLLVNSTWAPLGADRFFNLMQDSFYDNAAFFRVVPNFVVQFGIAGKPSLNEKWNITIPDDPVIQSNLAGFVSYATAGPNTRTTQLFINLRDNARLDKRGFAPFGKIIRGMDIVEQIYNPTPNSTDGVDQDLYSTLGNDWIISKYPDIQFILKTRVIDCPTI